MAHEIADVRVRFDGGLISQLRRGQPLMRGQIFSFARILKKHVRHPGDNLEHNSGSTVEIRLNDTFGQQ